MSLIFVEDINELIKVIKLIMPLTNLFMCSLKLVNEQTLKFNALIHVNDPFLNTKVYKFFNSDSENAITYP